MTFKFSKFTLPPVEAEFKPFDDTPDGEGALISINQNYLSTERIDRLNALLAKRIDDLRDRSVETEDPETQAAKKTKKAEKSEKAENFNDVFAVEREQIRFRAQILGGMEGDTNPENRLIESWKVVDENEKPIPVCFETFVNMPKKMLDALYEFCASESQVVKKKNAKP